MSNTAYKIISEERTKYLDAQDYSRFTGALNKTQELEETIGIWEYGKWCAKGALERLDVKRQIKYQGSPPDHTAWDALIDISDEAGMRIHAATVGLHDVAVLLIELVYVEWRSLEEARRLMRIGRDRFYEIRREALKDIAGRLAKSS